MDSRAVKEVASAGLVKAWLWSEGARGGERDDEVTPGDISAGCGSQRRDGEDDLDLSRLRVRGTSVRGFQGAAEIRSGDIHVGAGRLLPGS